MFTHSLEIPFRKILNNAVKHDQKDYECPILSNACPFKSKQFVQRIELGQQAPKEFVDMMLETVISDLNKPSIIENSFESKKYINQILMLQYSF